MDRTKEYYKLFWSTFWHLFKTKFGTRDIIILIFAAFVGTLLSYLWGGKEFMVEQVVTFVGFSVLPLAVISLVYLVNLMRETAVTIYTEQKKRLANRSWYDVDFEPVYFTNQGRHITALKVRNNKPIEITELNLKIYELWKDGEKLGEQRDMYWSGTDDRLHSTIVKDVLCPDGGEGIAPITVSTSKKAYLDDVTMFRNNEEDLSRRVYLKPNTTYSIDIILIGRMDT